MNKKPVFIAVGVVVVLGLIGIFSAQGPQSSETAKDATVNTAPRIAVTAEHAYLVENNTRGKELKSGDIIVVPATIETDESGRASVLFADGSVARLDGNTRIVLHEGTYDAKSGKLVVRLALTLGRVWSKIVELTTGDSAWEVETSRAVATVRGTAFGATNDASGSTFIGSENTVSIAPIDPTTRKALANQAAPLGENKSLTVTDNDAISAGQGAWHPEVKDITPETAPAEWINENKSADEKQATLLLGMSGLSHEERMKRLFEGYGVTINDSGNGEVTIKTNEGTWTANDKLPADFPRDVPIYPGATVQGAVTATQAEQGGHYVGLETRDVANTVAAWYKAQIASAGWAIAMNMESGGSFIVGGSKDNRTLMVTISSDEPGKTVIGLAVSQQ